LPNKVEVRADGRRKLFTDIAHPVNMDARERIQTEIVRAYRLELERSKSPGYQAQDLDALYQDDNSFQREDPPHSAKPAADSHLNKTNSPADKASARRENPE
jgi:stage V sporulation protein G